MEVARAQAAGNSLCQYWSLLLLDVSTTAAEPGARGCLVVVGLPVPPAVHCVRLTAEKDGDDSELSHTDTPL
jgi:hypothetical protein